MPSGTRGKLIISCSHCKQDRPHYAKQMCQSCYLQYGKEKAICSRCSKLKTKYSKGLCQGCYIIVNRKEKPEIHQNFLVRSRRYREKYKDKINERNKKNYDPAKERIRSREKYLKHKDKINARNNIYAKTTEGYLKQKQERRKERRANEESTLTEAEWQIILFQNHYRCYYCKEQSGSLHHEHKIPAIRGGGYTKQNIVPACPTCNSRKHTKTEKEFLEILKLEKGG